VRTLPNPTLANIARHLEHLHCRTPRGETRWSVSSVQNLLAQAVAQVDPARITTCVVQGRVGFVGAASVVFPDVAQARRLGRAARADATLRHC